MKILFIQYSKLRGLDTLVKIPSLAFASIAANIDVDDVEIQILEFFSDALTHLKDSENITLEGSKMRKEFIQKITDYKPDIIGLTCKTFEYCDTLELAKIIRSNSPQSLIVLGGYHATIAADSILDSNDAKQFDILVRGEGELVFNQLVKARKRRDEYWDIPNLSYKRDGEIVHNPQGPLLDIDKLKLPNRNLRINKKQFNAFGIPIDIVETSRGCVFNCRFCCIRKMYGKSFRRFKIDRIIQDLKDARKHGARGIFIADDNIIINAKHFEKLCDAIIKEGLNRMLYVVQISINGILKNPHLIPKMKKAGMKWIFVGLESPDPEQLASLGKDDQFNEDKVYEAIRLLQKHKFYVNVGMIFGTPDESEKTILHKFEYAKALGPDLLSAMILTPYPGTETRDDLLELDLITNKDDFSTYTTYHANVRTKHLTDKQLFDLVRYNDREYQSGKNLLSFLSRLTPFMVFYILPYVIKNFRGLYRKFKK